MSEKEKTYNEILRNKIGEIIKMKRREYGYSQADLAGVIGSSINTVQNIENGKTYPSIHKATLIDFILNTSISRILLKDLITESAEFVSVFEKIEHAIDEEDHEALIQQEESLKEWECLLPRKSYHYKLCLFYKAYITYISGNKKEAYKKFEACLNIYTKSSFLIDELNRRILLKMLDCESSRNQRKKIDDEIVDKICQRMYKDIYEKTDFYKIKYKALIKIIEMRILIQKRYDSALEIATKAKQLVVKDGDAFENHCVMFYKGVCEYMNKEDKVYAEEKIRLAFEFFNIKEKVGIIQKYQEVLEQLNIRSTDKLRKES